MLEWILSSCVCVSGVGGGGVFLNRRHFLLNTHQLGHVLELKDKVIFNLYLINCLVERE